jgi:hypothetical protein
VILYLVHAAGGVYAVSFLCWSLILGMYFFLHRSMVLRGANPLIAVIAIFAFSGFLRIRIQPRPEIFTYFFISLTICLLTEYFYGTRKRILYLFPLLALVWANSHASYLIMFVLFGIFFADRLARAAYRNELAWERLKGWIFPPILAGGISLVVCGLNPHGYDSLLAPLHLLSRGGGGSSVLMSISELTPVKGTGFYAYYKAAAAFALVSLLLGAFGRRVYLLDLLLFSIAFKGSWESARAVSMMGLFLSPGVSLHITGLLEKTSQWFSSKAAPQRSPIREKVKRKGERIARIHEPPRAAVPAFPFRRASVLGVVVLAMVAFGGITLAFSFSQLEYGIGMTEHKFSFEAAKFLRENPVPGRMFNFFDIGGFLDWQLYPQAMTYIDGRTYNQSVFQDHQIVTGGMAGWQGVLEKYGATYAVLKTMDSSGMILPIVPVLSSDPNWSLVFSDGLFVVFVRSLPSTKEYIRRHQIPKETIPRHIILEAYHYMYLGVSPVLAYQTIANMYLVLGDREGAIRSLQKALEEVDNPYLRSRLAQLQQTYPPQKQLRR